MSDVRGRFGVVIGTRTLVTRDKSRRTLTVSLGKPRRMKGNTDWECPFRIHGAGITTIEYGYGVDAIQALTSALEGIRVVLDDTGRPLSWFAILPDDTGFQRLLPISFGAAFSKRLNAIVDREIARELKKLERRSRGRGRKISTPAGP